jgi:EmrB/QacA subfamily drug resistance transporter
MTFAGSALGGSPPVVAGRWRALAVVALAQFMLILDVTVVNVALPDLGVDLGMGRSGFTWAVSVYGLVFGGLLLLGGRLADLVGARTVMLAGLVVFTGASLGCGLAQSQGWLLAGRVGQGVGAALLSPAALATITAIFHGAERNRALSVWASLGGLGFTAGVLIGGLLTAGPGWRWVFFINVPVGIALLATIRVVVPPARRPQPAGGLDVLGAVSVTAATGALIYGMINAGDQGWTDPGTLLPITAAIVLYGLFVLAERALPAPLLPLPLLAARPIAAGVFLMLTASGVLIADLFLASQYLQHLRGLTALETGLFFLPAALALMAGAITAGRLVGRVGPRRIAVAALILVAAGNAWLIGITPTGDLAVETMPGTILFGLGGGPLFVCATTTALGRIHQHRAGLVSGIINTANQLGAATCVAIASTIAAAGLTGTPTSAGFTNAYTTFTVISLAAAAVAVALTPGRPPATQPQETPQ